MLEISVEHPQFEAFLEDGAKVSFAKICADTFCKIGKFIIFPFSVLNSFNNYSTFCIKSI